MQKVGESVAGQQLGSLSSQRAYIPHLSPSPSSFLPQEQEPRANSMTIGTHAALPGLPTTRTEGLLPLGCYEGRSPPARTPAIYFHQGPLPQILASSLPAALLSGPMLYCESDACRRRAMSPELRLALCSAPPCWLLWPISLPRQLKP